MLRERRRALGMDQAALARQVGVSRQWVVGFEAGKERAEVGLVLRALAAVGIELHTLPPGEAVKRERRARVDDSTRINIDALVDAARRRKP